jgi:hypothetical protein
MKTYGNIVLMAATCIVIFWVFMALRPASAQDARIMGMFGPGPVGGYSSGRATPYPTDRRSILKRCAQAGVLQECLVYSKRPVRR